MGKKKGLVGPHCARCGHHESEHGVPPTNIFPTTMDEGLRRKALSGIHCSGVVRSDTSDFANARTLDYLINEACGAATLTAVKEQLAKYYKGYFKRYNTLNKTRAFRVKVSPTRTNPGSFRARSVPEKDCLSYATMFLRQSAVCTCKKFVRGRVLA